MLRGVRWFLAVVAIMSGPGLVHAQESPLPYFSGDVDVLIRLKEPDQTIDKVVSLFNKVQPGTGDAIKDQLTSGLGNLISNPTLTGVDQSRDWYVGVYTQGGEKPPVVVFAIPAVKPDDVVGALAEGLNTKVHDRFVLFTDGEMIPETTKESSAASKIDASTLKSLAAGDLSIYVNISRLSTVYAEQLELAHGKVLEAVNQLRYMPQQPGVNVEGIVEMYGALAEGLFKGIEDGDVSVTSIALTETDILINKSVAFINESDSAKFLARNPVSNMPLLNKLPANALVYFGLNVSMGEMIEWSSKLTLGMLDDKATAEKVEAAFTKLGEVKYGPMVGAFDLVDAASATFRGYSITEAQPIETLKAVGREMTASMASLTTAQFKQESTLEADAETYGEYKADLVTVKQEFAEEADPLGMQKIMQKVMFGDEGIKTRNVYLSNSLVSSVGGGEKSMKNLLSAISGTRTNAIAKAREGLMEKANYYFFVDLAGMIGKGLKVATQVDGFPLPMNKQQVDSLNLRPSYIAAAGGSEGNVANMTLRVPVDQVVGIAKLTVMIGASVQGMQQGL